MVCRIEHNYSRNLSPFDVLKQFSWYNEKVASLQGNDEGTTLVLIVRFVHIHHTMKLSHNTQLWKIALRPGTSTYLNPKMMFFIAVADGYCSRIPGPIKVIQNPLPDSTTKTS
ncbi:hypothetical protein TNCT_714701 [Trichonephila clavata]|uniref:Uncharacterized protein n=1 Tax=Trichonephila clavata TaxID=2740835 RepID=A0A8X6GAL2_TRICU|nr:hypothetical protein TNCT_714701 [Trichonephila clavata]